MATHDANKMISYLTEMWGTANCPMCHKGPLEVQDKIFQLTEFNQGSMVVGGPVLPVIPITCTNCGNTLLVNAIVSKVIDASPSPAASDAASENKTEEK